MSPPPAASFALIIDTPEDLVDLVSAHLFELGAGGIEERESTLGSRLVVHSADRAELARWCGDVEAHFGPLEHELEVVDPSWTEEWIRHLKPERITERFVMQPVGALLEASAGTRAILYEPTLTFGSGGHATTRLCAREIERYVDEHPGCRVLDVGAGTGVLSFVAALAGAGSVLGIDVDPIAVSSATRNAELNGLDATCRFSGDALERIDTAFDLVVANIEIHRLEPLLDELARLTGPGATLLLSGMLHDQTAAMTKRLAALGLDLVEARDEGEFRLVRLRRAA